MKDYSMYRYYKGEKENPFEAIRKKSPNLSLSNALMWWFYESCFEIEFLQKESSDWFSFFGGNHNSEASKKFMKLLSEEDYERPTEKKKAGVFDLWLNEYLFVDKLGPEYGENWYIKDYYSTSAKELLQLSN